MWTDPIVEEIRNHSEEYAASFNHDLKAICDDLRKKELESMKQGWKFVTLEDMRKRYAKEEAHVD